MDTISIRHGENVTLPIETGDRTIVSADIYIGNPGEAYILTDHIELTEGAGIFRLSSEETKVPLGEYCYQINTTDRNGYIQKYPAPHDCGYDEEHDFPKFIVAEALDLIEVS